MKADVKIVDIVDKNDVYDFIFLTVKENQVHNALEELSCNSSSNIVTMVNTIEQYDAWEKICGKGKIIPAFPGAGGGFEGDVLYASLTPYIIQPTTFSEINGNKTERLKQLARIFKKSKIPYQMVNDMHIWQLCHLAMVVPLADAYYLAENPEKAGYEKQLVSNTASQLQQNFRKLHNLGIVLSPKKMNLFRIIPKGILSVFLGRVMRSDFGYTFMYKHSMKAPDEMRRLHNQFYGFLEENSA